VAGAEHTLFDLLPNAAVLVDEPETLHSELEHSWGRIEEAHERSGIGNLVKSTDLYFSPEDLWQKIAELPGADFEHLGLDRSGS
jgi:transcription-repair coupling factor (superfamily II helicase)